MNITGFKPISETTSYVKMLLYGHPGSGKTRFCADAPNPIWIDTENSTETLRNWPEYKHIPTRTPKNSEEIFEIIKEAIKSPEVDTIVIDSVTSALDFFLRQRVEAVIKKDPNKRSDPNILYEADYKYLTQVFSRLFNDLTQAPLNVVVIFHEGIYRNPETQKIEAIFPDVTPRLRQAVSRLVNVVAYLEAEHSELRNTSKRKLYVNPTGIIEAKNRLNISKVAIENPEWKTLFNV